jgi:PAS domain S-box-containing protein
MPTLPASLIDGSTEAPSPEPDGARLAASDTHFTTGRTPAVAAAEAPVRREMSRLNEAARLAALADLSVLDSPPEPTFDALTRLAASICSTPVSLVSLVDAQRQWFKSNLGMEGCGQIPRSQAFCDHTIRDDGLFVVADAARDERFSRSPLVLGEHRIRFYAGAPLRLRSGAVVGTLCVIDRQPRQLTDTQRQALLDLAAAAVGVLEMRGQAQRQGASDARFNALAECLPLAVFANDEDGEVSFANDRWRALFDLPDDGQLLHTAQWQARLQHADRGVVLGQWKGCVERGQDFEGEFRLGGLRGLRYVRALARPVRGSDGQVTGHVGLLEDVTERRLHEQALAQSELLLRRTSEIAGVGGWELDLLQGTLAWSAQTRHIHEVEDDFQPDLDAAIRFYAPEARATIRAAVDAAMAGGPGWDLELPLTTARGRSIWVRARGEVEYADLQPVRLMGTFEDVTVRRESEVMLQRSRDMLRVLYESSPAMMLSVDSEGRVLTVTDHWLECFGRSRPDVVGQPAAPFFAAGSAQRWRGSQLAAMFAGTQLQGDMAQMLHADGSPRDVRMSSVIARDDHNQPRRALLFVEDLTAQLANQAELRREQQVRQRLEDHAQVLQRLLTERDDMLDVLAHEVRQPLNNASAALQSATAALVGTGQDRATARLQRAQKVLSDVLNGVDNTLAATALLSGSGAIAQQSIEIETLLGFVVADLPLDQRSRVQMELSADLDEVTVDMGLMRLALRNLLANALKYSPAPLPVTLHVDVQTGPGADAGVVWEVSDQGSGFDLTPGSDPFARGSRGARGGNGLGLYIARRVMELHGGCIELTRDTGAGSTVRMTVPL